VRGQNDRGVVEHFGRLHLECIKDACTIPAISSSWEDVSEGTQGSYCEKHLKEEERIKVEKIVEKWNVNGEATQEIYGNSYTRCIYPDCRFIGNLVGKRRDFCIACADGFKPDHLKQIEMDYDLAVAGKKQQLMCIDFLEFISCFFSLLGARFKIAMEQDHAKALEKRRAQTSSSSSSS
jgi:hypothetical protein